SKVQGRRVEDGPSSTLDFGHWTLDKLARGGTDKGTVWATSARRGQFVQGPMSKVQGRRVEEGPSSTLDTGHWTLDKLAGESRSCLQTWTNPPRARCAPARGVESRASDLGLRRHD